MRALLYSHQEKVSNFFEGLSENIWTTDEISFEDHFVIIKQKHYHTNFINFRKLFGELSVSFWQTVGDSCPILVQHFSQVYLSKQAKNQCSNIERSNTPFKDPIRFWTDLELTNQTVSLYLAIQKDSLLYT